MLAILSPAKRLDFGTVCPFPATVPSLLLETRKLAEVTRQLNAAELTKLMKLSPALAQLNEARFQTFRATPRPAQSKPAIWAFDGDTYTGLSARSLSEEQMLFAQDRIAILSGLYGLLRPLDAILPYRLEMGTRLRTNRGESLYDFWGNRIALELNRRLKALGTDTIVNLASQEYFQAVDRRALQARIITPIFKENRADTLKIISFSAKRARGAMARYLVETRASEPEELKKFCASGYAYRDDLSDQDTLIFVRESK